MVLLVTVLGCSKADSTARGAPESTGTGSVSFSILWPQGALAEKNNVPPQAAAIEDIDCAALGVATVEATMRDAYGIPLASGSWPCSAHGGTIDNIPEGSDRKIVVTAKDSVGFDVYQGEKAGVQIVGGQNTNIGAVPFELVLPIVVLMGSIAQQSEVDHLPITFSTSGKVKIDVQAWESCTSNGTKNIPTDFFGDGNNNNKLISNIFLFNNQNGTLVDSKATSFPGDVAPGAHTTRSGRNPYLVMNISAGTYRLAIGSYPLSEADAWAGVNTDGSSWSDYGSPWKKYKINIYFQ